MTYNMQYREKNCAYAYVQASKKLLFSDLLRSILLLVEMGCTPSPTAVLGQPRILRWLDLWPRLRTGILDKDGEMVEVLSCIKRDGRD